MKKIVSVLLCAILAFSIIPFSAHTEEVVAGTINVDMVWDELSFVYAPNYPGDWDIETHTYKNVPIGGWKVSDDTNNITVTNNSEVEINVSFAFEPVAGNEDVSLTFYNSDSETVTDIVVGAADSTPVSATVKVVPTGELSAETTSATKIGSITVTFSVANS